MTAHLKKQFASALLAQVEKVGPPAAGSDVAAVSDWLPVCHARWSHLYRHTWDPTPLVCLDSTPVCMCDPEP